MYAGVHFPSTYAVIAASQQWYVPLIQAAEESNNEFTHENDTDVIVHSYKIVFCLLIHALVHASHQINQIVVSKTDTHLPRYSECQFRFSQKFNKIY